MLAPVAGAVAPFRGLWYIATHPRPLLPWLVLPVLVNIAAVIGAFIAAFVGTPWLIDTLLWSQPHHPFWVFVWTVLTYSMAALLFIVAVLLIYLLASAIGSPFYDRLSAEVERIELGDVPGGHRWFAQGVWSIAHSLIGLFLWVVLVVLASILNLIPGIGTVLEFIVTLAGTAFLVAREMLDGPLTRRRFSFAAKIGFVARHIAATGPFGLVSATLLWVPLLNFVVLPAAVVGGTLLYLDLTRDDREAEE
jgi:CysZ protein